MRRSGGRLETQAYLREVYRAEGKLGSRYDSNVTAGIRFRSRRTSAPTIPILDSIIAPTTTAMVDFVTRTVGWKYSGRYNALSYEVNQLWPNRSDGDKRRDAISSAARCRSCASPWPSIPKMRVLIAHGWDDLSCPFMASVLIVDQMPVMGDPKRARQVKDYPGGHMFYAGRPARWPCMAM